MSSQRHVSPERRHAGSPQPPAPFAYGPVMSIPQGPGLVRFGTSPVIQRPHPMRRLSSPAQPLQSSPASNLQSSTAQDTGSVVIGPSAGGPEKRATASMPARRPAASKQWSIRLGAEMPDFFCNTTHGDFRFHQFLASEPSAPHTILLSHPSDFTPVCTTEIGHCESLLPAFLRRGVKLIGISCNPVEQHWAWSADILHREGIQQPEGQYLSFPLIADPNKEIVTMLGMLDPEEKDKDGLPLPARALIIIGPDNRVKLSILYPATTGRNFEEVLRVIDSLQLTADLKLATPVNWRQGERCIVDLKVPSDVAKTTYQNMEIEDLPSGKQYMRFVDCPALSGGDLRTAASSMTGSQPLADITLPLDAVRAGYGSSTAASTAQAVAEAVQQALAQGITMPSIALVACTADRDVEEVRREFCTHLPGVPLHGLTTSSALLSAGGAMPAGVGCLLLEAPHGSFTAAYHAQDPVAAAEALKATMPEPQAIIMSTLPGLEETVLDAIQLTFHADLPIYGGTAADNDLSGAWCVLSAEGCSASGVCLLAVGQNIRFGASMVGPYAPTTHRAVATRASGRRVYEVDHTSAADWVHAWLGEEVDDAYVHGGLILPQTAQRPIGLKQPSGEFSIAHLAALGGPEKHIDFFAPVPEGSELVIMDAGNGPAEGYASTLAQAYNDAVASGGLSSPSAGVLIYCGGMAIAVGEQLDVGLVGGLSQLRSLPLLGVACFGEQAYQRGIQRSAQQNLQMGMLLFE